MANVVYLGSDPNAEALGKGASGLGAGLAQLFMKKGQDLETENYLAELIKTKQAEEERARLEGGQPNPNAAMLVPPPRHIDLPTRVALVNQVFKQPTQGQAEELVSYFRPPTSGKKGAPLELVTEQAKGLPRPKGTYTREEIASFLQFPSEGRQPTEKEGEIESELRTFGGSLLKGVPAQTARDRVRLYKGGEPELQKHLTQAFGVYNKDTDRYEIEQPELVRKSVKIQRKVKELMYQGKAPDWQGALDQAYEELGVEPPKKPEPPAPPQAKKGKSITEFIGGLFSGKEETKAAPATSAPATQGAESSYVIGAVAGQEVRVPSNMRDAKQIQQYLIEQHKLSPDAAAAMIRRYASQ